MSQPLGSLEGEPLPRLPQGAARCRKGRRATARRAAAAGRAAAEGRAAGAAGAGSQGLMPPTGEQPDTCEKDIQGQSCSHARAHAGARGAAPGDAGKHAADRAVCEARRRASEPSRGRWAARTDTAGPDGRCCCCAPGMYVTRASRQPRRRCTRGGKGGMIKRRGGTRGRGSWSGRAGPPCAAACCGSRCLVRTSRCVGYPAPVPHHACSHAGLRVPLKAFNRLLLAGS